VSGCPSVCLVHQHKSRTERPRKPKFGKMEAHHTSNPWTYLEIKRSKVKVTRPINAHTVNAQYFPNGKAYKLQTWYIDGARRTASATSTVTSKVKGQSHKVTLCVWQVLDCKSRTKRYRNTKIGIKVALPMPGEIMRTSFKVKRSRSRPINTETESVSYLWNGKACRPIRTTMVKVHLKEFLKTDTISKKLVKN